MRLLARVLLAALAAVVVSQRLVAQLARPAHPLLDSARLFGAEWTATTLLRADSLATDSLTLRSIDGAYWLGPGRLVYSGRLAQSGQRALLGWVNGTVTLLAIDGREFSVLPGRPIKVRFGEGLFMKSEFTAAGGAFYISTVTGRGFSVYATDGATWRPIAHREDSVTVRGRRLQVAFARVAGGDEQGPATIALDGDGFEGLARIGTAGLEVLVARNDTLPGGYVVSGGFARWMQSSFASFRTATTDRWSFLLRGRTAHLIGPQDGAPRELARSTEPMPNDSSRRWDDIWRAIPLADGRFVLEVGRGGKNFLVGRPGAWRAVASGTAWLRERSAVVQLRDASVVDSTLTLIALLQAAHEPRGGVFEGRFPDLYSYDGSAVRPVPWDSVLGTTMRDIRRIGGGGFELSSDITFRRVPGYSARLVVTTPHLRRDVPGGRLRPVELLFDPVRRRLVRMPSLRAVGRDSVSLGDVIGWNSDDEGVALLDSEIVTLRRPPLP
jgi:hypothetical protein